MCILLHLILDLFINDASNLAVTRQKAILFTRHLLKVTLIETFLLSSTRIENKPQAKFADTFSCRRILRKALSPAICPCRTVYLNAFL